MKFVDNAGQIKFGETVVFGNNVFISEDADGRITFNTAITSGTGAFLSGLIDVNITSLQDDQFLRYQSSSSNWINQLITAADVGAGTFKTGTFVFPNQVTLSAGPLVIGIDPGGGGSLRVGGNTIFSGSTPIFEVVGSTSRLRSTITGGITYLQAGLSIVDPSAQLHFTRYGTSSTNLSVVKFFADSIIIGADPGGGDVFRASGGFDLNGPLRVQDNNIKIGTDTRATQATLVLDTATGQQRDVQWMTAGLLRWDMFTTATAESGGNAGSNFSLAAYDDAGSSIDTPFSISRAAGGVIKISGIGRDLDVQQGAIHAQQEIFSSLASGTFIPGSASSFMFGTGAAGTNFRGGFSHNIYWNGANWILPTDGVNNGGMMWLGTIGSVAEMYLVVSSGSVQQSVTNTEMSSFYKRLSFNATTATLQNLSNGLTIVSAAINLDNVVVNKGNTAQIQIDGIDAVFTSSQMGIGEVGGNLAYYARGAHDFHNAVNAAQSFVINNTGIVNIPRNGLTVASGIVAGSDPGGIALVRFGGDLRIGTLGTFDSTGTRFSGGSGLVDNDLLSYNAVAGKWQPRFLQTQFTSGVVIAQNNGDSTFASLANSNPTKTGTPTTPAAAPILTPVYNGMIIDMSATALPANCVYGLDYSDVTINSGTFTTNKILSTSSRVVHSNLNQAHLYTYHYRIIGVSSGTYSPLTTQTAPAVTTEVNAFGLIVASQISTVNLASISANIGQITAGQLQSGDGKTVVQLDSTFAIPGTATQGLFFSNGNPVGGGITGMYLDFTATGANPLFKHSNLALNADGTAVFNRELQFGGISQPATPATGRVTMYASGAAPSALYWLNDQGIPFVVGMRIVDRAVFTNNGTWTKPNTAVMVMVHCWGSGGGGGGGSHNNSGNNTPGGSGGGGGAYSFSIFRAADLPSTIAVTIGTGGTGGAGTTTAGGNGGNGTVGGASLFGTYAQAGGGAGGTGGIAAGTSTIGGAGGGVLSNGGLSGGGTGGGEPRNTSHGGADSAAVAQPGNSSAWGGASGGGATGGSTGTDGGRGYFGGGAGAAGGSTNATNATRSGGAGGTSGGGNFGTISGGGGAGGAPGANGTSGANTTSEYASGAGGGGGGSDFAGAGGSGGNGGIPAGGAGGGGGNSGTALSSGAGGTGGQGQIIVYALG